ncbi:ergothioneine biosynthesis protein EgtB [Wenzhouxiangella marina]|uniref:Uncharacterized protein n=1 Tax=Wenzhouxiangella marina TaxID=1579979 RepID=A0A0K0XXD4_9GAMM|nr:ergothioneine biosynthesis protein EgtB [Wenzhouxiangella marina]AKS42340.1 hypothetical protein WM2015_1974 [Wenzhouxiangella marina]MBB6085887.1 ergothioneine biosynthesis protein EgtB [Wenzhouxiangella marina]
MASATPSDRGDIAPRSFNRLDPRKLDQADLAEAYDRVRRSTEALIESLGPEDQNLQSMPDASPVKWHRAHTSWFFETFILKPHLPAYRPLDPGYEYLFNSYYNGVGRQYPRPRRGLISRPDQAAVTDYRRHVDGAIQQLLIQLDPPTLRQLAPLILLGLNHEQQHQELIVTDLKHAFSFNPAHPPCFGTRHEPSGQNAAFDWLGFEGGLFEFGHEGPAFAFDNEMPRHRAFLAPFELGSQPVSCAAYLAFMDDGGYERPELWLSDGWSWRQVEGIDAPLYWWREDGDWWHYSCTGARPVDPDSPICHLSFYEAWAFAEWSGARLPSELEWEHAVRALPIEGHFADRRRFHPEASAATGLTQAYGSVWEWTSSAYAAYPGFRPGKGAVGEYNGKFMANQMVLRGGSCATAAGHLRASYRNFFHPHQRWQFSGLRLARSAS